MGRKRRTFNAELKAEAVRLCGVGDRTIRQVARDLDLTETALRSWVKLAGSNVPSEATGAITTSERAELKQLRKRVKRLEMEREILKISSIAATAGYYDQAHLIAEFRAIAGVTPRALLGDSAQVRRSANTSEVLERWRQNSKASHDIRPSLESRS